MGEVICGYHNCRSRIPFGCIYQENKMNREYASKEEEKRCEWNKKEFEYQQKLIEQQANIKEQEIIIKTYETRRK